MQGSRSGRAKCDELDIFGSILFLCFFFGLVFCFVLIFKLVFECVLEYLFLYTFFCVQLLQSLNIVMH
jgi:hypothetical protein